MFHTKIYTKKYKDIGRVLEVSINTDRQLLRIATTCYSRISDHFLLFGNELQTSKFFFHILILNKIKLIWKYATGIDKTCIILKLSLLFSKRVKKKRGKKKSGQKILDHMQTCKTSIRCKEPSGSYKQSWRSLSENWQNNTYKREVEKKTK